MTNEEEVKLEQPNFDAKNSQAGQCEVVSQKEDNKSDDGLLCDDCGECENSGSNFGKFKDAQTLFEAYKNLQTDYTKKCQMISSLKKQMEDNMACAIPEIDAAKSWQQKVEEFLTNNPQAEPYKNQIAKMIFEDENFKQSKTPLEDAWAAFAKKNFPTPQKFVEDKNLFDSYVLNNPGVVNKIVKEFLVKNKQSSPSLILNQLGSSSFVLPQTRPKTIKEASEIIEDIFDN